MTPKRTGAVTPVPAPRSTLGWALLTAVWALGSLVLGRLLVEVTGDFVGGWVTTEVGTRTGIAETDVKAVVGAFLPAMAIVGGAMWVTAVVVRWRLGVAPPQWAPSATPDGRGASPHVTGAPFAVVEDFGRVRFDYSMNNGRFEVGSGERVFVLRFTKASDTRIHLTKHGTNLEWVARVKAAQLGAVVDMAAVERSSDTYPIGLSEFFMAQNAAGHLLQGRVLGIADDQRGADKDEVEFTYYIMAGLPSDPGKRLLTVLA